MIRSKVALAVSEIATKFMFDVCKPNEDVIERVLSFDADELDSLDLVDLSKFIVVLGQYLVSMKYSENEITVQKIEVESEYDRKSMFAIRTMSWKTNVPLKEKKARVTADSEELSELLFQKEVFDSQLAILDGMYGSIVEYLNAYKREQSRRVGQV